MDHDERVIKSLLRKKDKTEALRWLSAASKGVLRTIGEHTPEDSISFISELYEIGAVEVLAVNIRISPNGRVESTDTILVALPPGVKARKQLFDWNLARLEKMEMAAPVDFGQSHLLIWFD